MDLSIDRLTVCGNVFGDLEGFYSRCMYIDYKGFAKYPYRHSIHFQDGSVLQVAEKENVRNGRMKELRYDFNPNHKEYNKKLHYQVLGLMKDSHFTRIDVALDVYDLDMSTWKWVDSLGRPKRIYMSGKDSIETWYIGGKDSQIIIRIYDKAKEQKTKDGRKWWRVEVQMRRDAVKLVEEMKGGVFYNPFKDVSAVVEGDFKHLDIKTRAMVKYLLNEPQGFSELSSASRAKYRKLIKEEASKETIDFAEIWEKKYSLVASELESWITFTRITN